MKVEILKPCGCCAGVNNAISLAIQAREKHPDLPIYVLGMLVHNESVINHLTALNIITLQNAPYLELLNGIEKGVIIFTAHGHDEKLDEIAKNKGLIIYDTTCSFVKYNHKLIKEALNAGRQVIFIGKKGHPEAEGSLSISKNVFLYDISTGLDFNLLSDTNPLVICQTTLSIYELENIKNDIVLHCPGAKFSHSICNATTARQKALHNINYFSDLIIIVGSKLSSNTSKLFDIALKLYPNKKVIQIKTVNDIVNSDLSSYQYATIVGGASTPLNILEEIQNFLKFK